MYLAILALPMLGALTAGLLGRKIGLQVLTLLHVQH